MTTGNFTQRKRKSARGPSGVSWAFEDSIDRFATAAATVSTQIASHAQRMDAIDAMTNRIQEDIRDIRQNQSKDTQFIHTRIDTVQRELTTRLDNQTKELTEHFDTGLKSIIAESGSRWSKDGDRIKTLESWNKTVVGGAAVIGFVLVDLGIRLFGPPIMDFFTKFMMVHK